MLNKMNFENYNDYLLSLNISQIAREFGFKKIGINSLYLITHLLKGYIELFAKETQKSVENSNRMESNLIDLLFTLQDNQINQNQLIDYIHDSKIKNDFAKARFLIKLNDSEEKERISQINKINSNSVTTELTINENVIKAIPFQLRYFPREFSNIPEEKNPFEEKDSKLKDIQKFLDENNRKRTTSFNDKKNIDEINKTANYFDMSKKHTRKKNFNDIGNVFNDIDYEDECTLGKKIKREDKIDIYDSLAPKK